jgi:hypothetical protein
MSLFCSPPAAPAGTRPGLSAASAAVMGALGAVLGHMLDRPGVAAHRPRPAAGRRRRPHRVGQARRRRIDPYHWLRDRAAVNAWIEDNTQPIVLRDRAVIGYIAAENAHADRAMRRLERGG